MINKIWLLVFSTTLPAFAQETGGQEEKPPPPITFRVVAVGQTPPERYKTETFDAESKQKEKEYLEKFGTPGLNTTPEGGEGEAPPALSTGTVMIEEDPR